MTLVQHAGMTSTVSGPAALSTYLSASESLHPAQADVHFSMYSSLGISAIVSNSWSNDEWIGEREWAIVDMSLFIITAGEKSIRSGLA
jgi:dipeptide/tripeptide permease